MKKLQCGIGLAVGFVLVMFLATGCEKTVTSLSLDVTPASSEIQVRGAVNLTASSSDNDRQLYYPLVWSVSDGTLGSVRNAAGDSAVYVAGSKAGVNTIVVQDQMGAEGIAVVTQVVPGD